MTAMSQTIDRDTIPAILLLARRKSGKTQTRMLWTQHLEVYPIHDDIVDDDRIIQTGTVEKASDFQSEYLVKIGDRPIRVIDVPGEILQAGETRRAGEYQQQLLPISKNIRGVVLCVAPPVNASAGMKPGYVLTDRLSEYRNLFAPEAGVPTVPTFDQAMARLRSALAYCEQFLQLMDVDARKVPFAVQFGFSDFVALADSSVAHRQRCDQLDELYRDLFPARVSDWLRTDCIEARDAKYATIDGMVRESFLEFTNELAAKYQSYRFWHYCSTTDADMLGHRSPVIGFTYLYDQIVGKEQIEDNRRRAEREQAIEAEREQAENERLAAEALERDEKERRDARRRRVTVAAVVAGLVAIAAAVTYGWYRHAWEHDPTSLPFDWPLQACRDTSIAAAADRCGCVPLLAAHADLSEPLERRLTWIKPFVPLCGRREFRRDSAESLSILLHTDLLAPLTAPDQYCPERIASLLQMGATVGGGLSNRPLFPAASDGEKEFLRWLVQARQKPDDPPPITPVLARFPEAELKGHPAFARLLASAVAAAPCLDAWRLARANLDDRDRWKKFQAACPPSLRDRLPARVRERLASDLPAFAVETRTAQAPSTGNPARDSCAGIAGLDPLLFPSPSSDVLEWANLAALAGKPEEVEAYLKKAAAIEPSFLQSAHAHWLHLTGPYTQDQRIAYLNEVVKPDGVAGLWEFYVASRPAIRWVSPDNQVKARTRSPVLSKAHARDAACALAGSPWRGPELSRPIENGDPLFGIPVLEPLEKQDPDLIRARLAHLVMEAAAPPNDDVVASGCAAASALTRVRSKDWDDQRAALQQMDVLLRTVAQMPRLQLGAQEARCWIAAEFLPPGPAPEKGHASALAWLGPGLISSLQALIRLEQTVQVPTDAGVEWAKPRARACALHALLRRVRDRTDAAARPIYDLASGLLGPDAAVFAELFAAEEDDAGVALLSPDAVRAIEGRYSGTPEWNALATSIGAGDPVNASR